MAKKPSKDQVDVFEDYLKYGIDLYKRRIFFGIIDDGEDGGDFNFATVEMALRGIKKLEDMGTEPIELYMNSSGGDPYDMFALYDVIQESDCKFIFYGRGKVMSSASWIMCGCDERFLSRHTRILLHQGRDEATEDKRPSDQKIDADEALRLQRELEELYAENSYMDKSFYRAICKEDMYLNAEEALQLGLITGIIAYRKRGNLRKKRIHQLSNPPKANELRPLIRKLYKRIDAVVPNKITIEVKKEEFEDIPQFDNTEEVMAELNLKPQEEQLDGSGTESTD